MLAVIAPRSVAARGEGLAPGRVRAGQLEPVLGGVDERREHPEVARHQGAVGPGPLSLEPRERRRDVLPAHGDQVARDVDVGVLAGGDGAQHLEDARAGSRQDHRGVGLLAGDDAGRVDVDVGPRSVGGGQPGAQERGMTGPVEDAATVEDTDRLVVGAVDQHERHLQDHVDGPRPRADQQDRDVVGERERAHRREVRARALGGEPATRRQPVPQDLEQACVVGGRAGDQAHGAVSSSQ